jgi:hypothetical protein
VFHHDVGRWAAEFLRALDRTTPGATPPTEDGAPVDVTDAPPQVISVNGNRPDGNRPEGYRTGAGTR